MIRFSCPGCGAVYSVTDEKAGKTGKCPKCQTPFTIPAAEAPAPAAPPPPPPKPSSNPFADLADDDAPKKKKPSKADLDDDYDDRPKKKPARAVDDEDDRPKKKPRRDEDDDYDDAPKKKKAPLKAEMDDDFDDRPKKKAPSKAELDDEDDRPKKKGRRDEDDDYDDAPKKKPARAAADDDFDDEDDRPRKKKSRSDDYDDEYDDRPRKKKKSNVLLLTAAILHIVIAAVYLPCGGLMLAGAGFAGDIVNAGDSASRDSRNQVRFGNDPTGRAVTGEMDRRIENAKTGLTLFQIAMVLSLLGAVAAIVGAVGGFMKKKWFAYATLASGGIFILLSVLSTAALFGFFAYAPILLIFFFVVLSLGYGVFAVIAATNRNVKRVLS